MSQNFSHAGQKRHLKVVRDGAHHRERYPVIGNERTLRPIGIGSEEILAPPRPTLRERRKRVAAGLAVALTLSGAVAIDLTSGHSKIANFISSQANKTEEQTKKDLERLAETPSDQTEEVIVTPFGIDNTYSTPNAIASHFVGNASSQRFSRLSNLISEQHKGQLEPEEVVIIPDFLVDRDILDDKNR